MRQRVRRALSFVQHMAWRDASAHGAASIVQRPETRLAAWLTPRPGTRLATTLLLAGCVGAAAAQPSVAPVSGAASATGSGAPANSVLDGELFYQLFISELELVRGDAGVAYQVMLEAARRSRDESLFRRSVEIAVSARAGEQALTAAKAWRTAVPKSRGAAEVQAQLLVALNRSAEAAEPMRAVIEATPAPERPQAMLGLARLVLGPQAAATAGALAKALEPWRSNPATRSAAQVATARGWAAAGDTTAALDLLRDVLRTEAGNEGAALVALDLMAKTPAAEELVRTFLAAQPPSGAAAVRLGYARRLTASQRYADALRQAEMVTSGQPSVASAWLLRGALQIEMRDPKAAQASLQRYLDLQKDARTPDVDDTDKLSTETSQAYLMLAQAAEQLKDYAGAQTWLDKLGEVQGDATLVARRASLLARQGRLKEARALIGTLPEDTPEALRSKVMTETQLLRDVQAWQEAYAVLVTANTKLPDDADLLYEQALLAERLKRFDEMERLLKRVIQLNPAQQHAYNALGYSLVDRNIRVEEGRQLIADALSRAPGDPFITDSLGWAEFRLGRTEEALRLLRQAYDKRPDTEIAAHLGEVLWTAGRRDEAREVWRSGAARDADNDVLKETLSRLKVKL